MRLRVWIKRAGRGALWRLAAQTGISYPTLHRLVHDLQRARYATAKAISEATSGEVSIAELCELPDGRRAAAAVSGGKRKRKRASERPAAAA